MFSTGILLISSITSGLASPEIVLENNCAFGLWFYIQENGLTPPEYARAAVWLEPGAGESLPVPLNSEGLFEWAAGAGFYTANPEGCVPMDGVDRGSIAPGYWCPFLVGLHSTIIEWTFTPYDRRDLYGTIWYDVSNVQGMSVIPVQVVPFGEGVNGEEQDPTCQATGQMNRVTEEMCPVHPVYGPLWDFAKATCIAECDACRMHYYWLSGPEQDDPEICGTICCPGSTMTAEACYAAGEHQNNEYSWMAKCAGSNLNYAFALDGWEGDHRCRYMDEVSLNVSFCPTQPDSVAFDGSYSLDTRTSQTGKCVPTLESSSNSSQTFPSLGACVEACTAERRERFNAVEPVDSPAIKLRNTCGEGLWFFVQENNLSPEEYKKMAVWLEPGQEETLLVPQNEDGFFEWAAGTGFYSSDPLGCQAPEGVENGARSPGYECSFLYGLHSTLVEWNFAPYGAVWYGLSNVQGLSSIPVQISPVGEGVTGEDQDPTCGATGVYTSSSPRTCPVHPVYGSLWDETRSSCIAECDACRMHYYWLSGPEQDDPEICGTICCPGSTMTDEACFAAGEHQNNEYSWMAKCAGSNLNNAFARDGEGAHRCRHLPSVTLEVTFCPAAANRVKFDPTFTSEPRFSQTGKCVPADDGETGANVYDNLDDCVDVCVGERRSREGSPLL